MSTITDIIGKLFSKSSTPTAEMHEMGEAASQGRNYIDTRDSQTLNGKGGSYMIYSNGAWYGVLLTSSTSTTTTSSSTTTTTTSTSTS